MNIVRSSGQAAGRFVDCGADPHVRRAAANVASHRRIDVGIGRFLFPCEQRGSGHDLPRLTIAALRHIELLPCRLDRFPFSGLESFDRGDLDAGLDRREWKRARARRLPVDMDGAGAAKRHAAAELGAGQLQMIAQDPSSGVSPATSTLSFSLLMDSRAMISPEA